MSPEQLKQLHSVNLTNRNTTPERLRMMDEYDTYDRECIDTHMDKSSVLLIDLHQLLVRFVPHGGLWVRSHGDQIWHTLSSEKRDVSRINYLNISAQNRSVFVVSVAGVGVPVRGV